MSDQTYSQRLGRITDAQFTAATERLGVGKFLRATPVTSGLFGQNVFLSTSEGEFVLRGAPHWVDFGSEGPFKHVPNDRWQFAKEILFAKLLHERTDAPVPWPQLLDEASDIFGWPYIIMPRMPGTCFDERSLRSLPMEQQRAVATALGEALVRQQSLTWPFAGDVGATLALEPYPGGHAAHVARETARFAESARLHGALSEEDDAWVARIVAAALAKDIPSRAAVYVHGDYKPGNLCLTEENGAWRVSGLFDLHESRFGDGASDLCRQMCSYLDTDASLAKVFLDGYRAQVDLGPALEARFPLYLINERMKIWEYFTRPPQRAEWLEDQTFRGWTERYLEKSLQLLRAR